ncbi:MAG: hypothetical protein KAT77_05320 [Nanoarchaeota archaeon]|nr:hypothetical protein [Nanoarchaeota archaeon]
MKWSHELTRELLFHTIENWRYAYFEGWFKFLGFGLKETIYYSKKNIVQIYRVNEEVSEFIKQLTKFCLEKPDVMMGYYNELEKLDKKLKELGGREIKTKSELRSLIQEVDEMMNYYGAMYLIKVYSNRALTNEVKEKRPELVKKAEELLGKADWFDFSRKLRERVVFILDLPEKIVKMLTLKEIIKYIDSNVVDFKLAEERYNGFFWNLATDEWFYGEEADKQFEKLEIKKESAQDVIKGAVASKGKVTGEVVIVLGSEDFNKIKEGCILVANMTTPWYTPYMSKVKAIVTDEGGIGTHAAIISREFGIPCIIGTKVATQVLKDGDLVEVDAEKGVVRKL